MDPFYELAMTDYEEGAYLLRKIAPDRFFKHSEYYERYFNHTRMVDELGCLARIDDQKSVHLSIGRSEGGAKYKNSEISLLQSLCAVLLPLITRHCRYKIEQGDFETSQPIQGPLKEHLLRAELPSNVKISPREAEIAALIVKGYSSTAIGLNLDISHQTVKVHRRNIYKKLKISSQAELFSFFQAKL